MKKVGLIAMIGLSIMLMGCKKQVQLDNAILVEYIEKADGYYAIYVDKDDSNIIYYDDNGNVQKENEENTYDTSGNLMYLTESDESEEVSLNDLYEGDLEQATKYYNYFISHGYEQNTVIHKSESIDILLTSSVNNVRLICNGEYIVVTECNQNELLY